MCGIVGYVGEGDTLSHLSGGLKNLEYRGYDSAGIAVVSDRIDVYKQAGRIDELDLPDGSPAPCGLGHTRWSTHGKPSKVNAHPHTDCTGDVAVVHNGIIENYDELRSELRERGHEFTSETDTEVIPHMLEDELTARLDGGISMADQRPVDALFAAVEAVVEHLTGSFAIATTVAGAKGLIVTRQDSPLVVGHGSGETFVASDVTAFLQHTREVSYLEDDDVVRVTPSGVEVSNDGERIERPVRTVDWEAEAAEKGGYEHYMLKEIHEQPHSLRQTLSGRVTEREGVVDLDVTFPEPYLHSLEEIQIVACGTSYHAGLYAKQLLEELADVRVTIEIASEYNFQGGRDPWRTLVIAITQSGETADTLTALRRAARAGANTLAVTNTVGSTAAREAGDVMYIRVGPEIGVAATKTFAGQVAALTMLAVHLGQQRHALSIDRAGELLGNLRQVPGAVQQVLDEEAHIRDIAETYGDAETYFFIGRQLGTAVVREGALKLKEISYVHAEGFPAGELKHGTLALVTSETPVLSVLTDGARPRQTLNNVKEVQSRGAPVIGLSSLSDVEKHLDVNVGIPEVGVLEPLVANVAMQLFAYHVAISKGRPVDKPRNLAKSVTVE